jgi:hypothetical protein
LRRRPRFAQRRQEDRYQYCNNSNYNEQFDEREGPTPKEQMGHGIASIESPGMKLKAPPASLHNDRLHPHSGSVQKSSERCSKNLSDPIDYYRL